MDSSPTDLFILSLAIHSHLVYLALQAIHAFVLGLVLLIINRVLAIFSCPCRSNSIFSFASSQTATTGTVTNIRSIEQVVGNPTVEVLNRRILSYEDCEDTESSDQSIDPEFENRDPVEERDQRSATGSPPQPIPEIVIIPPSEDQQRSTGQESEHDFEVFDWERAVEIESTEDLSAIDVLALGTLLIQLALGGINPARLSRVAQTTIEIPPIERPWLVSRNLNLHNIDAPVGDSEDMSEIRDTVGTNSSEVPNASVFQSKQRGFYTSQQNHDESSSVDTDQTVEAYHEHQSQRHVGFRTGDEVLPVRSRFRQKSDSQIQFAESSNDIERGRAERVLVPHKPQRRPTPFVRSPASGPWSEGNIPTLSSTMRSTGNRSPRFPGTNNHIRHKPHLGEVTSQTGSPQLPPFDFQVASDHTSDYDLAETAEESDAAETNPTPFEPSLKRGKIFRQKVRNAILRPSFLKLVLGKELAKATRPGLEHLAHGEQLSSTSIGQSH